MQVDLISGAGRTSLMRRSQARSVLILISALLAYVLYEVHYKTGIRLVPFLPIDDSGFDVYTEELLKYVSRSEAAAKQPKSGGLLCWVMTTGSHHKTRLPAINSTWLSKCDSGHFLTDSSRFLTSNTPYHTTFENLPGSYFKLFWKTRLALLYLYQNVSSDFDWYFKADDDTYVVVENLKSYLKQFDPDHPHYIGFRLKRRAPEHGYNAGGSGYALSRAAMKIWAEKLFHDHQACAYHEWEDLAVARCLESQGIYATDSRDRLQRQRFLPWRPEYHFSGDLSTSFLMDPVEHKGLSIFHEELIAMHHLQPQEIYLIHGMLYGVSRGIYRSQI